MICVKLPFVIFYSDFLVNGRLGHTCIVLLRHQSRASVASGLNTLQSSNAPDITAGGVTWTQSKHSNIFTPFIDFLKRSSGNQL